MMEFVQLARVPSHSYETYTLAGFVHKLTEMMINVPGSTNLSDLNKNSDIVCDCFTKPVGTNYFFSTYNFQTVFTISI